MLLFCSIFIGSSFSAYAQDEISEPAEIIGTIETQNNRVPSIGVSEWTTINVTVRDAAGINWTRLSTLFPFQTKYLWPIIHPTWKPFLGLSSLRFEPEIIEGNPRGWYTKITPSAILEADQGKIYNLKLEVKTDDIAVDYAVVVGIKVTRTNIYGEDSGESYIYIPVKASALNNIKMEVKDAITTKETAPHSQTHFDVTVKNRGYYKAMFKLEFIKENGIKVAASKQLFVLNPDESQNLRIDVLTLEKFYDMGTPSTIEIYATSSGDPNPMHIGTVVVITKGIYISPLIGMILIPIIIIIILIYFIFFYLKQKREQELFGKPEKPWNIPVERKHLEELKQKDKEAYEKERSMMEDEYKSAMLWYDSYHQSIKQEKQIGKSKQLNLKVNEFFKKPENKKVKPEKKKEEKQPKKEKKPEKKVEKPKEKKEEKPKETPEIVKEQYKAVQKRSAESERRKQIALEKIKRAQEKQKGKIKK